MVKLDFYLVQSFPRQGLFLVCSGVLAFLSLDVLKKLS